MSEAPWVIQGYVLDAMDQAEASYHAMYADEREQFSVRWPMYPEHNTDSPTCWCEPHIEEYKEGRVIIHRGEQS